MPIYEYRCKTCGHMFEFLVHSVSGSEDVECSNCGSSNLDRGLTVPVVLKGQTIQPGSTCCCGATERCETPPCVPQNRYRRD